LNLLKSNLISEVILSPSLRSRINSAKDLIVPIFSG